MFAQAPRAGGQDGRTPLLSRMGESDLDEETLAPSEALSFAAWTCPCRGG